MDNVEAAKQIEAIKRQRNINTVRAAQTLMMGEFDDSYPMRLICECFDASCNDLITVINDGYRVVERKGNIFYVKPGHEHQRIEKVLHKSKQFYVVEKENAPLPI